MLELGVDLRPPRFRAIATPVLAVVARGDALKGRVAEVRLEDLDKQIEQGALTLDELEELALRAAEATLYPDSAGRSFWHDRYRRSGSEFSGAA